MSTPAENEKTFTGGCHCGAVKYSATLSLPFKGTKCNCSICLKTNLLSVRVVGPTFTLISPASLADAKFYAFGTKTQKHYFCPACGIHCFGMGKYEFEGKAVEYTSVNAVTLDPEQGVDLREVEVEYWDGRGNNWMAGSKPTPFEGGVH